MDNRSRKSAETREVTRTRRRERITFIGKRRKVRRMDKWRREKFDSKKNNTKWKYN